MECRALLTCIALYSLSIDGTIWCAFRALEMHLVNSETGKKARESEFQ